MSSSKFRLADQLTFLPWQTPDFVPPGFARMAWDQRRDELRCAIANAVHIQADAVSEYIFAGVEQEEWSFTTDLPCVAPPFPSLWLEMRRPSAVRFAGGRTDPQLARAMPVMWGWHFWESGALERRRESERDTERLKLLTDARWHLCGTLVAQDRGRIYGPVANFSALVGADGMMLREPVLRMAGADFPGAEAGEATTIRAATAQLLPALFALCLMHCKNVALIDVPEPTLTNREARQLTGPAVRFKTLNIEPIRRVLSDEGQVEQLGLRKALHIIRGHFARYSPDKPLFGRPGLHGDFWIPSHVRGASPRGILIKDYCVDAQNPASCH